MDYNATVNLPKTDFPMRAGLPKREPDWLKAWEEKDLYGGLQLGGNFRHGKVASLDTRKTDLSVAPRLMLGFNLGRVVELHAGGLAGIAAVKFDGDQNKLAFCWGGFGGLRLNFSDSFGLVLEGCYSPQLPYGLAGIAFKF